METENLTSALGGKAHIAIPLHFHLPVNHMTSSSAAAGVAERQQQK